MKNKANICIQVSTNNVERALKRLKKQMEREGVTRDIKRTVYFESPSSKRRKQKMRAIKQNYIRVISQRLP